MGFPSHWTFYGGKRDRTRVIGNAVCPQVAYAIGREVARAVGAQ